LSNRPRRSPTAVANARDEWAYRQPDSGHWDEAFDAGGHVRPHWRRLAAALRRMGYPEFVRRWDDGQRLIQANGVTYNVYGDPQGAARPWPMDLVPLVISAGEWADIEQAVVQRAMLLNAIVADVYGPQRLVQDGLLPPELVYASPRFLRACHGLRPAQGVYLQNIAVDIARAPTGAWWVIADRTQAPSGAGYALENRLVSTRTLSTVLDRCDVRPLTPFFDVTIRALMDLASRKTSSPRAVVMTAGPHSETYFEHSFFARQWDFPLVTGADLTVRDGHVFLKTLEGLNPVDVIVRRLDDDFCDPLTLRGESLLGVPGLVEAVRAGHVFVANSLGSGWAETPALPAFLPGLCRHIMGQNLRMPSAATWWCGQEGPLAQVLENLERLVVKPTFPRSGVHSEFPATMSVDARDALAARIQADPSQYVAQEQVDLSTTPVHTHRGLESRHVVFRVIAAWDGASYAVLPGGLTRVATGQQSLVVAMQAGGGSKDAWVLGQQTHEVAEHEATGPSGTYVTTSELSSRVADSLLWLGRYAERLESITRLVRALLPAVSDNPEKRRDSGQTALHFLRGLELLPSDEAGPANAGQWWALQRVLVGLVFDAQRPTGVSWNVEQVRRLSWQVKDRLSQDTWRVLQQLESIVATPPPASHDRRFTMALARLDDIVMMLSAFAGLLAENPTRGHGWRFLAIGRRLERAIQMLDLLRVGVATAPYPDDAYLEVLLQVADSSTTYRSRYLAAIETRYVLELLLADATNPRSVAFQVDALVERTDRLPTLDGDANAHIEHVIAGHVRQLLRQGPTLDELKQRDSDGQRETLAVLLQSLRVGITDLSDAMSARYLMHSVPALLRSSP
jgi:uncharacterized circularly permuted ATP-grasp superfamily protein/uncharacterized alpha-E superfamily protein